MSSNQNRPFGEMKASILCRSFRDAELKQMSTNDGGSFEIVTIPAVCSPYCGSKEPQPYWLNLTVRGAATNFAQKIKKGTEMLIFGSIRPRAFTAKDGTARMSIEVDVSRDIGSIQITRWPANQNNDTGGYSGADSGTAKPASEDSDLPF